MKKLTVAALALATFAFAASSAMAVTQTLNVTSSQKKKSTKKKPRATTLHLSGEVDNNPDTGRPYDVTSFDIKAADKFGVTVPKAKCSSEELKTEGKCTNGSLVASGTATVDNTVLTPNPTTVKVDFYNTTRKAGDIATLRVYAKVSVATITDGLFVNIRAVGGKPVIHMDVTFPDSLKQLASPIVKSLDVTTKKLMVKKGKKKLPFLYTPTTCSGGVWNFTGSFNYTGGLTATTETSTRCS